MDLAAPEYVPYAWTWTYEEQEYTFASGTDPGQNSHPLQTEKTHT